MPTNQRLSLATRRDATECNQLEPTAVTVLLTDHATSKRWSNGALSALHWQHCTQFVWYTSQTLKAFNRTEYLHRGASYCAMPSYSCTPQCYYSLHLIQWAISTVHGARSVYSTVTVGAALGRARLSEFICIHETT